MPSPYHNAPYRPGSPAPPGMPSWRQRYRTTPGQCSRQPTVPTVTWVHADAAGVPAAGADLAVMTGNVAQVFLTDEDWAAALRATGAALSPRGYLVFETRRPERRAWEEWAADTRPVMLSTGAP